MSVFGLLEPSSSMGFPGYIASYHKINSDSLVVNVVVREGSHPKLNILLYMVLDKVNKNSD